MEEYISESEIEQLSEPVLRSKLTQFFTMLAQKQHDQEMLSASVRKIEVMLCYKRG